MSAFWVVLFLVAVLGLVLMDYRVKLPPIPPRLRRLFTFDIRVPKRVQRIMMWLIALAVLVWLIRDLDDTLRHHYFCERHPDALACPQEGDSPESPY